MTTEAAIQIDGAVLVAEMQRYLAAVETFRAEGREPSWLPEGAPRPTRPRHRRNPHRQERTS
jgi:hypothetical protein